MYAGIALPLGAAFGFHASVARAALAVPPRSCSPCSPGCTGAARGPVRSGRRDALGSCVRWQESTPGRVSATSPDSHVSESPQVDGGLLNVFNSSRAYPAGVGRGAEHGGSVLDCRPLCHRQLRCHRWNGWTRGWPGGLSADRVGRGVRARYPGDGGWICPRSPVRRCCGGHQGAQLVSVGPQPAALVVRAGSGSPCGRGRM